MIFGLDVASVAQPEPSLARRWRAWCLAMDLDTGVDRMVWRGRTWLPPEHMEEYPQYQTRLVRSDLYPGLRDALDRATAEPFSRPVTVIDAPPQLAPLEINADGDGNDLTQFGKHLMRSACKFGRAHVLVDYTQTADGQSRADELAAGPRPFFRLIEAPELLNWRTEAGPDGAPVFAEVRLWEVRDGAEFVRVIRPSDYELWQNNAYKPPRGADSLQVGEAARYYDWWENRQQDWVKVESGRFGPPGGLASVPLVTVYTGYRGYMDAEPAFQALAETNLTHWRSSSDQRNIVHVARVPILFATGMNAEERKTFTVAASSAIGSDNPDARLQFVEHSGSAVQLGTEDLAALERRMETLGATPHVERTAGASATGAFLAANGAATDIQAWAQAVDTALEQAYGWAAEWMGLALPETFDVQIFKDYAVRLGGTGDVALLQQDVASGRITPETYLREAKRRGLYGDDLDVDAERESLEATAAANPAIQDTALNGAQVTAAQGIIEAVSGGALPREAGSILIRNSFPAFDESETARMVAAAEAHAKTTAAAGGTPTAPSNEPGGTPAQRDAA